MIKIIGAAKLYVPYEVELDMTEDDFDALSEEEQTKLLDAEIDWHEATRNATVDEIEVDQLEEW